MKQATSRILEGKEITPWGDEILRKGAQHRYWGFYEAVNDTMKWESAYMNGNKTDAAPGFGQHPPWCLDAWGGASTFEQHKNKIESFHGYPAPGLLIGGKMVDMALSRLPQGRLFNAIAETGNCLPDAIQVHTDRFAKVPGGERSLCPVCKESYPRSHGRSCRACAGDSPHR